MFKYLIDKITKSRTFQIITTEDQEVIFQKLMKFYNQYKPSYHFDQFNNKEIISWSKVNLSIQLGTTWFTGKYQITGKIEHSTNGTILHFTIKNDILVSILDILIFVFISIILVVEDLSTISICFSALLIIGFATRWFTNKNRFDKIESELRGLFEENER